MGGRSSLSGRPPLPLFLTALLPLLLLLPVPAESYEDQVGNLSHFPSDALKRLESRPVSLPPAAFQFDGIANGSQRYPDHMRYRTMTNTSLCKCRNRCLAETRCLGFEHEASSGTCGLTDVLLTADVTQETAGDWSTGRRRGISWLGQPCHEDSDCVLFARDPKGVECYQNKTCSCREGWTRVNRLLCRPNIETNSTQSTDQTTEQTTEQSTRQTTEQTTKQTTEQTSEQTTEQTTKETTKQTTELSTEQTTKQTTEQTTEQATEQITTPGIDHNYINVSGRLFRLTDDLFPSTRAALECLMLGGVQYVPDSKKLVNDLYEALNITSEENIGVGFNDVRSESNFDTADGSDLTKRIDLLTEMRRIGSKNDEDCGALLDKKLHDFKCDEKMQHLCEYIGPNLLDGLNPSGSEGEDTWWTYNMSDPQQISTVLYLAGDQHHLCQTEIYVGNHSTDASEDQSTLCVKQEGEFLTSGFARRFTCPKSLTGQYLHVRQSTECSKSRLWTKMAAFGEWTEGTNGPMTSFSMQTDATGTECYGLACP